jgi:hypothetical protein
MNITADQVRRSSTGSMLVDQEIKTILKTFQAEIVDAGKSGYTNVVIPVPMNFNIANVSNQTAQTIIYHRLIDECEAKGFNVRLSMSSSAVTYNIRWDIKQDSGDLKSMREVIASHISQSKKDTPK